MGWGRKGLDVIRDPAREVHNSGRVAYDLAPNTFLGNLSSTSRTTYQTPQRHNRAKGRQNAEN
jgi:hypothetical protein